MFKATYASYQILLSSNLNEVLGHWTALKTELPLYLQSPYLKVLEGCSNRPFQQFYGVVLCQHKPVGVVLIQRIRFEWIDSFHSADTDQGFWKRVLRSSGRYVLSCFGQKLSFEISSIGNQTISGTHGFYFLPSVLINAQIELLEFFLDHIQVCVPAKSVLKMGVIKDFTTPTVFRPGTQHVPIIQKLDPEMVLHISNHINTIEDYITSFSKKYRQRYKAIKEKGREIDWRILNEDDIIAYSDALDALYAALFERSEIQLLKLPKGYFKNLAVAFPNQFHVLGGFYKSELVVFGSCIKSHETEVSAHYIGINFTYDQFELYQNLLYQFITFAINQRVKTLHFGRTAAEIKSTVGAVPQDLLVWIYPRGRLSRWAIQNIIARFKHKPIKYRSPFKKADQEFNTVDKARITLPT